MNPAPILVQVYTRKSHFIKCIESLAKCRLADKTDLFIASDTAKTKNDECVVKEIRDYCTEIKGFAKVELITSAENMGAAKTCNNAIAKIFSEYNMLIYTEDDNIFASNFLEYINDGLMFYKNNPHVFAICGYRHPFKMPSKYSGTVFPSTVISPWGFAIWKDKYYAVDLCPTDYYKYKKKKRMAHVWHLIMENMGITDVYGDAIYELHCLKNDMVNIFPRISLVRNYGSDGSGIHSGICNGYNTQEISDGKDEFIFIENIITDKRIENRLIDSIDYPFQEGLIKILHKMKIKLPIRHFIINRPRLKEITYWILRK